MARSSILLPHALQLYVQLLHIKDPSPRRRRFASESRSVSHVLHRKQLRCHRWPAKGECQQMPRVSVPVAIWIEMYSNDDAQKIIPQLQDDDGVVAGRSNHDHVPSSNALPSSRIYTQHQHQHAAALVGLDYAGANSHHRTLYMDTQYRRPPWATPCNQHLETPSLRVLPCCHTRVNLLTVVRRNQSPRDGRPINTSIRKVMLLWRSQTPRVEHARTVAWP